MKFGIIMMLLFCLIIKVTYSQVTIQLQPDLKKWMENVQESKLGWLTLPGTHHSGMTVHDLPNGMFDEGHCKEVERTFGLWGAAFKWTLPQQKSIQEQLDDGIRVFDIRYAYYHGVFRVAHGGNGHGTVVCRPLETLFDTMENFLKVHKTEVIVVLLRNEWLNKRQTELENLMTKYSTILPRSSVSDYRDKKVKQLKGKMIFTTDQAKLFNFNFIQTIKNEGSYADGTYATNSNDGKKLLEKLNNNLKSFGHKTFYHSDAICTPDDLSNWTYMTWTLLEYVTECNKEVVKFITNQTRDLAVVDAILFDNYTSESFHEKMVDWNLNYRKNVSGYSTTNMNNAYKKISWTKKCAVNNYVNQQEPNHDFYGGLNEWDCQKKCNQKTSCTGYSRPAGMNNCLLWIGGPLTPNGSSWSGSAASCVEKI